MRQQLQLSELFSCSHSSQEDDDDVNIACATADGTYQYSLSQLLLLPPIFINTAFATANDIYQYSLCYSCLSNLKEPAIKRD